MLLDRIVRAFRDYQQSAEWEVARLQVRLVLECQTANTIPMPWRLIAALVLIMSA